MESMRDINRVMEREIKKGSCPIKLNRMELREGAYQEIVSEEKFLEVVSYLLRTNAFCEFATKMTCNNVYLNPQGKTIAYKRVKNGLEKSAVFNATKRSAKKWKMEYAGEVYLETVHCIMDLPKDYREQCKMTYNGEETYGFIMSDKYMLALFTHCLVARKELAFIGEANIELTEQEQNLFRLENIETVLFQALVFDQVSLEDENLCVELHTIYLQR